MSEAPEVTAARIEVGRAKAQLLDSAHDLQARLKPKLLARNAWEGAKVKGADLAEDAVDAVRKRPLAATGVAAAIGLYLARHPLMELASHWINGSDEPDNTQEKLDTETVE